MNEILGKEIISIVADISGYEEEEIHPESDLQKDLEVDSIKAIEIAVAIEKKYRVSVRDEDIPNLITVRQVVDLIADLMKQKGQ
ncbi:MAG: acyl carrier protein [Thermodesulfovibrionales bacterium]|nr:acyl carrier protein [Thermodesulfovibrionales bacterium]